MPPCPSFSSYGMLLLRLFTPEEELPWPESLPSRGSQRASAERNEALRRLIVEGRLPPVPRLEGLSREPERRDGVQQLIRDCIKADLSELARPTFKEICERWEQIRAIQEQVPPSTSRLARSATAFVCGTPGWLPCGIMFKVF